MKERKTTMIEHKMMLVSADFKTIHAVVIAKRKAPLAQPEEPVIRNHKIGVQGVNGAPQEREAA
jgi:hypothetical protein